MFQCHTSENTINLTLSWPLLYSWSSTCIFPILLLLFYPMKPFQNLLNCFPIGITFTYSWISFKSVKNNTLDYLYFDQFIISESILHLIVLILFGVLRPYRNDFYNRLDCTFFGLLALAVLCILCNEYIIHLQFFWSYYTSWE